MNKKNTGKNILKFIVTPTVVLIIIFTITAYKFLWDFSSLDYTVMGIILFAVLSAGFYMLKRKKSGKNSCGGGCEGCVSAGECRNEKQRQA